MSERETTSGEAGNSDSWCSPPEVTVPLHNLYQRPVDVDPCSNPLSIVKSRIAYYENGLVLPWMIIDDPGDQSSYMNNPYSQSAVWFSKMLYELKIGHVEEQVCLVNALTSTRWWRDAMAKPRKNPRVAFTKRIKFLDPYASGKGFRRTSCRFEPALIYYGRHHKRFDREFKHIINYSTWGR